MIITYIQLKENCKSRKPNPSFYPCLERNRLFVNEQSSKRQWHCASLIFQCPRFDLSVRYSAELLFRMKRQPEHASGNNDSSCNFERRRPA